ncbi:hypothetical protein PtrSN002B_004993 [Pyrenophora tritici-repentis]|uniref:Uncharacterized protein n=2 Tax=Pyrenophora tritici-repentis TaxID=45151 RepID=A0A2W1GSU6_9PLEO|nr:uncharacterized protein PTRG_08364 [Pyrenophora tritici-repentis Pt-1C-BFP]KAA8615689.1 hypothetical protein PtrV1_11085 [Pyrenophora tritici-repentis]EDU51283.1 predicted protein [Pyrenophora tritici-repentis Pt-1C-BFP]KAF7443726.1 hypothetical protein A1F99_118000 [Pyrenophora tritici-repentis]KAG9379463.1 hypothetical protein A1F94_009819 [Pyrenophora tritici-repentis]KAI0578919.1 hypothetical protein Alg215_06091 [Pyrenophora tritici-repentis]
MNGQQISNNQSTIIHHIESLGLQTFGKERTDPTAQVRRPVFKHEALVKLYKTELPVLFGLLLRDDGVTLSRKDPNLFDNELDELLLGYGPQVWPKPGHGSREHLREAKEGTRYSFDVEYPRDKTYIKEYLRKIILGKRPTFGAEHYINKNGVYGKFWNPEDMSAEGVTTRRGAAYDETSESDTTKLPSRKRKTCDTTVSPVEGTFNEPSESEDSVLGTKTRRQARKEHAHSPKTHFGTELRLYCRKGQLTTTTPGPTWFRGSLMLTEDISTCEACFNRICEEAQTEYNFMVFQLPEDMSMQDPMRIDRGSSVSETAFQHVRGILQRARRFPGGPPHRSVEVEIGYDADQNREPAEEDRPPSPFIHA